MHDGHDDGAALLPGPAVTDKEAIAEERVKRMPHLRRLALEAVMLGDKGLRHGIGAVAYEQPSPQHLHREQLVLEAFVVEGREEVTPHGAQHREWRPRPRGPGPSRPPRPAPPRAARPGQGGPGAAGPPGPARVRRPAWPGGPGGVA